MRQAPSPLRAVEDKQGRLGKVARQRENRCRLRLPWVRIPPSPCLNLALSRPLEEDGNGPDQINSTFGRTVPVISLHPVLRRNGTRQPGAPPLPGPCPSRRVRKPSLTPAPTLRGL